MARTRSSVLLLHPSPSYPEPLTCSLLGLSTVSAYTPYIVRAGSGGGLPAGTRGRRGSWPLTHPATLLRFQVSLGKAVPISPTANPWKRKAPELGEASPGPPGGRGQGGEPPCLLSVRGRPARSPAKPAEIPASQCLCVLSVRPCLLGAWPTLVPRSGPACQFALQTLSLLPHRSRHDGFLQGGAGRASPLGLPSARGQGLQCAPLYLSGEPRWGNKLPKGSWVLRFPEDHGRKQQEQARTNKAGVSRSKWTLNYQDSQLGGE
jgi:hypothetical protein